VSPPLALAAGFADPVHDAQRLFRSVLDAFSHPGRIVTVDGASAGPGDISPATAAYLLTLVDHDTPLWLAPQFDRPAVRDFVRFHCGASLVPERADAAFAVLTPGGDDPFNGFALGTDPYPDRSATLVIEVPTLGVGAVRTWRGPGIDGTVRVAVGATDDAFWHAWAANHALFPCGVDVVFACGAQLVALPRSIATED
jgi:alpha-D-ribose 1-methylphosphonate 5-triphosphate synthase subunit PhnH